MLYLSHFQPAFKGSKYDATTRLSSLSYEYLRLINKILMHTFSLQCGTVMKNVSQAFGKAKFPIERGCTQSDYEPVSFSQLDLPHRDIVWTKQEGAPCIPPFFPHWRKAGYNSQLSRDLSDYGSNS